MSIECGICERDLRGGHADDCPRASLAAAAPTPAPTDPIRVVSVAYNGASFTVEVHELPQHLVSLDDCGASGEGAALTYTLTFKTITRAEFDALGEFHGF